MSTTTTVYALVKHARGDTPWDVEVNADLDTIDAEIARPRLPVNSPTVGATTTCDLNLARVFVFTVSQATTLAFTNVPSSSFAVRIRLLITNGAAFALTFPASVTWLSGQAPLFKVSGVDEVELVTKDAGTTWYASARTPTNVRFVGASPGGCISFQNNGLTTAGSNDVTFISTFNSAGNDLTLLRLVLTDTASAAGAKALSIGVGATTIFRVPKEGGVITQGAVLATTATRGFAYMPTCAGTPTGVPNAETGCAAMVYDTTANKIWFYNGAWRGVVVA